MTDPARIEAAARAMAVADGYAWGRMTRAYRDVYVTRARFICDTAYPELANGTAWLAPMDPSDAMYTAAGNTLSHFSGDYGDYNEYFERSQVDKLWPAMRDAHLKADEDKT